MKKTEYPRLQETVWSEVLPNGLNIRVLQKKGFAKKYAFFATDYGSIDTCFEIDGKWVRSPDGVAHYLEHKMFDMPDVSADVTFARNGASPNAFTSYGMTAYYFDCTENFAENLETLIRFVSTPYFTQESVDKERGIIAQEIRMYEDNAESRVSENLFGALFARHPVRVSIAGSVESIEEITPQTLYDCHKAFYDPSNMMLCVVGDVDPEQVAQTARRLLPQTPGGVSARNYGEKEPLDGEPKTVRMQMDISMPTFEVGFRCEAPEKGEDAMKMEIIGNLAAEILVGESSPLYTRLVEQGLIDPDFGAGYESIKGVALLSAGGDSDDPEQVTELILQEAERIGREGFDSDLFRRLKKSAIGRRTRDLDSFESICYRMCAYFFDGVDFFRFPEAYDAVDEQQVQQFLQRVVRRERMALSVIDPIKEDE